MFEQYIFIMLAVFLSAGSLAFSIYNAYVTHVLERDFSDLHEKILNSMK